MRYNAMQCDVVYLRIKHLCDIKHKYKRDVKAGVSGELNNNERRRVAYKQTRAQGTKGLTVCLPKTDERPKACCEKEGQNETCGVVGENSEYG